MKHSPAFIKLVEETMNTIREITPEELMAQREQYPDGSPASLERCSMRGAVAPQREQKYTLIDVREDHEWQAGHIQNAIHIGRGILERDIETKIPDPTTPLVLYCGGGYRSALAAESLQKMGYSNVFSLKGGWREWKEKSYPVNT